ncbi:DUF1330 domain-containing protein [Flavivirga algicola]|uniref:DUF1330 domain-containing protein n=1 Tax=Flavivirga algicola TaxID=2729136 RepID=A0ABX1S3K1_9FLAO|nr:DUF1330 domain-containing protein [Flavivirga algicola]NMH89014.1 DUF1330 domain-containing protein [Flavivirga algicola]
MKTSVKWIVKSFTMCLMFITYGQTPTKMKKEVTFKEGHVIEAILFSPKEHKKEALASYLTSVTPIAKEYGANILIKFKVENSVVGNKAATMIAFEAWPSLDKKRAFEQDERYIKLRNDKINLLHYVESGLFQIEETVTVTFHHDKAYDIAGVWLKKDETSLKKFQKYYGTVVPAAMKNHQYRPVVGLKAIPNVFDKTYHSTLFGVGEWPSREASVNFANSEVYQSIVHLRTESVANLDIFLVKPILADW